MIILSECFACHQLNYLQSMQSIVAYKLHNITQYIVRLCVNYEQQRRVALYIKLLYCFPIFTFIDLKQLFKVTEIISKFLLVDDLSL